MINKYSFFIKVNGLYFSFDYAIRFNDFSGDRLRFYTDSHSICSLDLYVSKLKFRVINGYVVYFDVVPVGGVNDGE